MAVSNETERRPWVHISRHFGFDTERHLDDVSVIAVREQSDVEIRDFTSADSSGKDYWGPDVSVLTLGQAQERVSPDALDRRIEVRRFEIIHAEEEIKRLEKIRTQLYGEQLGPKNPTS